MPEPVTQIARKRYSADAARMAMRWEGLLATQSQWRPHWQLLADYLDPNRTSIVFQAEPGAKKTQRLFDSTAPHAADLMGSNIHGALTNSSQKFFSVTPRAKALRELHSAVLWCENVTESTYYGINNSNFVAEAAEFYKDLVVFATAAMILEEGSRTRPGVFGGFRYRTLPCGTYLIDENAEGKVDLLYRKWSGSARACMDRFGTGDPAQGGTVPDRIRNLAEHKPEERVELIHAIEPRPDTKRGKGDKRNMAYSSCYFTLEEKALVAEGGYREFPGAVARWSTNAGEVYGRGPSWLALPDIRTLNRAIELYLSAGAKAVDPVLLELYEGVVGPISLEPAAINTIREPNALQAMESKSRWEIAEHINERLERKINQIFYVDLFDLQGTKDMTATEATIRNERTLRLLGPAAGRLMYEWFIPMREREIALQYRAKSLPPPPPELLEQGAELDILAEGPLARAQRSADLVAIERSYALAAQIAAATQDASIFDNWNHDKAAEEIAAITGMPATIERDEQDVAQMRASRLQQQQAQQKMQAAMEAAKAAGPLAQAMDKMRTRGQAGEMPLPTPSQAAA